VCIVILGKVSLSITTVAVGTVLLIRVHISFVALKYNNKVKIYTNIYEIMPHGKLLLFDIFLFT